MCCRSSLKLTYVILQREDKQSPMSNAVLKWDDFSPFSLSLALDPPSLPDSAAVRIVGKPPLCHSFSAGNVCKQAAHPAVLAFVEAPPHSAWAGTCFTDIRMRGACVYALGANIFRLAYEIQERTEKHKRGWKSCNVQSLKSRNSMVGFQELSFFSCFFYLIWLPGWTYKDHSV